MPYKSKSKQTAAQAASDAKAGRERIAIVVSTETKARWQELRQKSDLTADQLLNKLMEKQT